MGKQYHISSGSRIGGVFAPVNILEIGDAEQPTQLIIHNGEIMVYDSTGQTTIDSGVVQAVGIAAKAITASKLSIGQRAFVTTVAFAPATRNSATWTSGNIYFGAGEVQGIQAGTTGALSAKVYIYYDGSEYLRMTPSEATATIGNNAVVAIITPVDSVDDFALIQDYRGSGTTISGDKITTGHISANRIWVGIQSFVTDTVFSSIDAASAQWAAGTIKFTDGTQKAINAGTIVNLNKRTTVFSSDANTLALWHFDENSGTACDNAEGNASWDATASAAGTVNASGMFSYCRLFNGTSQYATIADYSEMDQTTFTWEGWFKTSGYTEQAILSREPTGSASWPYRVFITSTGYLQYDIKVSATVTYTLISQSVVNDGIWHHFAANFSAAADIMQLWIDGIMHTETTECTSDPPASAEELSIACSDGAHFFDGRIDELRFSDTVRTYTVANKQYIYYNNSATLSTSETYTDSVGTRKVLMAIMTPKLVYGGCEMQVLGNDGTVIDGNQIKTGKVSSSDGKTYFDLTNRRIVMNDGSNDRVLLGWQQGGF